MVLDKLEDFGNKLEIDTASTTLHHFNTFGYAYGIC
jgi:hypothetical protein